MRRWLVTGCSSGLGRALALAAARDGDRVAATARKPAALDELVRAWPDRITPIALDVRDPDQCEEAVRTAAERLGGIDVLVNNAGSGLFGAVEEVDDAELREQLEVLLVGPWRLVRMVLPLMRAQRSGHIVNVSSLAGRVPVPGLAAYVTGKFALEGMSQALAGEVAEHGIRVTVVEPSGFATGYGTALQEAAHRLPTYAPSTSAMLGLFRGMADNDDLGRPEDFADAVLQLVHADPGGPLRVPVGADAFAYLEAAEQAAREELAAARTLMRRTPPV